MTTELSEEQLARLAKLAQRNPSVVDRHATVRLFGHRRRHVAAAGRILATGLATSGFLATIASLATADARALEARQADAETPPNVVHMIHRVVHVDEFGSPLATPTTLAGLLEAAATTTIAAVVPSAVVDAVAPSATTGAVTPATATPAAAPHPATAPRTPAPSGGAPPTPASAAPLPEAVPEPAPAPAPPTAPAPTPEPAPTPSTSPSAAPAPAPEPTPAPAPVPPPCEGSAC
jgi:hypothetical protein